MKLLKNGLSIRGDVYYCPLSFQLDSYWNCLTKCAHCYLRRLNRTWGEDLRPLDIDLFRKKIRAGLKNKNPKSPLAWAIKQKKTIRFGNKTDPYQEAEKEYKVSRKVVKTLVALDWTFVIQTKFSLINRDLDVLTRRKENITLMMVISPGLEKDWEIIERKKTSNIQERLQTLAHFKKQGINIGINGEPFIPGYHTIQDFEAAIKTIKSWGFKSYNTYHLHFNDWNAKELHKIGIDIEKIWYYNQDKEWKKILPKLIDISKKYNINLGCPDFIHSGKYQGKTNTCCGMNVPNPCTFNIINWKKRFLKGESLEDIIENTWDKVGDKEKGRKLIKGEIDEFFSLKDIKF